jgi:hypothetical protein
MGDRIAGPPPESTPREGYSAFPQKVVDELLGDEPPNPSVWAAEGRRRPPSIALTPSEWPRDWPGLVFLHRALVRLLRERGGTVEAARSIRHDLADGRIRAVVVYDDDNDGEAHELPPQRWRTAKAGAEMLWTGRSGEGFIYLTEAPKPGGMPEPSTVADDWRIGRDQTFASWARKPSPQTEARRRLAAVGESAPSKERISAVLTAMARECGRELADDTIDRSLRRKPKTNRTPGN